VRTKEQYDIKPGETWFVTQGQMYDTKQSTHFWHKWNPILVIGKR